MKRVLLVHFSQTGQLARVARAVTAPIGARSRHRDGGRGIEAEARVSVSVALLALPRRHARKRPARAPELAPLSVPAHTPFDLVVLAYQVWFLARPGQWSLS
jgi:hypothetical protein